MLSIRNIIRLTPLAIILSTLYISMLPVEQSWSDGEMALTYIVPTAILLSMFINVTSKTFCKTGLIDILLIAWYLLIVVSAYIQNIFPVATIVLKSTLLLALFYAVRFSFEIQSYNRDYIAILIILVCLIEALLGIYQTITSCSRNNNYHITGTFLNPGPLGTLLSCGLILLFALMNKYRKVIQRNKSHYISNISLVLAGSIIATALLVTQSRSAILAFTICLLYMYRLRIRKHLWTICIGGVIFLFVLYLLKHRSADSRLIIWWVSINNITNHPLIGSGIGSFLNQYANGMAEISSNMKDGQFNNTDIIHYAFNYFLYIWVEQGVIGVFLFLSIIAVTFFNIRKNNSIIKWTLPILLITSLFSYTFELLPFQLITVIVCASLFSTKHICSKTHKTVIFALLIFFFILSILSIPYIKQRVTANIQYAQIAGIHTKEYIQDYYRLFPYMQENPKFLFDFAKTLANSKRYNDSNAILQKGQLISADPMFFVIQGNNYTEMGEFTLAEKYYKRGFAVMPNRIYPLYKLMLLYELKGQHSKSIKIAKRITSFPIKKFSTATKSMKNDAMRIINSDKIRASPPTKQ